MDPPTVVVPQRRPGRPPVDDSGAEPAAVHLTLPAADYDAAFQYAKRNRKSVQEIIRQALKRLLADEHGE